MYVYRPETRVRAPDSGTAHLLMLNPEHERDKITACGLPIWPDWLVTLRKINCEECIRTTVGIS